MAAKKAEKRRMFVIRMIAYLATFVIIGVLATVVLAFLLRADQCRDCNTGLGLCMLGFGVSLVTTPAVVYGLERFLRENVDATEDDIRLSKPLAGGGLMDVGCYCLNAMRLMTGEEPSEVTAVARWGKRSQVDETLAGTLLFPRDIIGHFDCSLRAQLAHTYEIRGTKGRIVVGEAFVIPPDRETVIRYWHDGKYEEITIPPANSYTLMGEDFGDALLKGRPSRYLPEDAVRNMELIDRLLAVAQGQG